jgi:hypothetical protein
MIAYKFLARGAVGAVTGRRWPEPGKWLEVEGPLGMCSRGVHLCRAEDLAHWLHDELWKVESEGDQVEGIDCLVARRARLVQRIDSWHQGGAGRFAEACAEHAILLADQAVAGRVTANLQAFIEDARVSARYGYFAVAAHAAALAVAGLSEAEADAKVAYAAERQWQGEWIAREVIGAVAGQ